MDLKLRVEYECNCLLFSPGMLGFGDSKIHRLHDLDFLYRMRLIDAVKYTELFDKIDKLDFHDESNYFSRFCSDSSKEEERMTKEAMEKKKKLDKWINFLLSPPGSLGDKDSFLNRSVILDFLREEEGLDAESYDFILGKIMNMHW